MRCVSRKKLPRACVRSGHERWRRSSTGWRRHTSPPRETVLSTVNASAPISTDTALEGVPCVSRVGGWAPRIVQELPQKARRWVAMLDYGAYKHRATTYPVSIRISIARRVRICAPQGAIARSAAPPGGYALRSAV